jgi:hypothetical protein
VENFCRVKVGRLMEIRIGAGFTSEADVDAQIGRVRATMSSIPTYINVVIAADWRRVNIMPESVAARALRLLTTTSDRIERSGILASPDSPTAVMQFFRLVRESQHPSRKVVTTLNDMESWLTPVLTAVEAQRLREFLNEG